MKTSKPKLYDLIKEVCRRECKKSIEKYVKEFLEKRKGSNKF